MSFFCTCDIQKKSEKQTLANYDGRKMARVVPRTTLPFQRTKATKATNTIKKGLKENKSFDFIFHDVKQIALISSRKPAI